MLLFLIARVNKITLTQQSEMKMFLKVLLLESSSRVEFSLCKNLALQAA